MKTDEILNILEDVYESSTWNIKDDLGGVIVKVKSGMTKQALRTYEQNRALHKDCMIIAEKLNDMDLDIKTVIRVNVPWTTSSVKDWIWRPIQKAMFGKIRTRDLKKQGEIDKIHMVLMRELGEKFGVEYHDFPHDPNKQKEKLEPKSSIDRYEEYPESNGEPTF